MTDALVNISHPTDPTVDIPFIGSRGPFEKIVVSSWQVKSIAEQGFTVEVIKEPYDPVEEHNAQVRAKAEAKAAAKAQAPVEPEQQEETDPVEPVEPAIPEATENAVEETSEEEEPEQAEETAPEQAEDPAAEEEVSEEEAAEEDEAALTEEQKQELRDAINGLSSFAEAKQFLTDQQVELDPMPSKLKDIKAALLTMVE